MGGSDLCDACEQRVATQGLNLFDQNGPERIDLCDECATKVKNRDFEIWKKIHTLLRM
jgi:protein-arginine kinase activator protein McsA